MKLALAILVAFAVGLVIGRFDHDADERRQALACGALMRVVDQQPNRAALWREFRATYADAVLKQ